MPDNVMRVAVVSTPRVGNTWVNFCLSEIANLTSFSAHRFSDLDGIELPKRFLLQVHASYDDKKFHKFIEENGFTVVTVARHPLDVLISMLRFVQVQTSPIQWLDSTAGMENLYSVSPADPKFVDWCLSPRAEKLLKISYDWAREGASYVIRYEDMLDDPVSAIQRLLDHQLHMKVSADKVEESLKKFSPDYFKKEVNQHGWKAQKDNWKNFFTKDDAQAIYKKYKFIFDYFNYDIAGASNKDRKDNLALWDVKPDKLSNRDLLYKALTELEIHNKRFLMDIENKKKEIKGLNDELHNLRIKYEEALLTVNHLEERIRILENRSLAHHTKKAIKHTVRAVKRRAKSALDPNKPVDWKYSEPEALSKAINNKSPQDMLAAAQAADRSNYIWKPKEANIVKKQAYRSTSRAYRTTRDATIKTYLAAKNRRGKEK